MNLDAFGFSKQSTIPGACPSCGGEGQRIVHHIHDAAMAETCRDCKGSGRLTCSHGVPRSECQDRECVCAEVLRS